MNEVLSDQVHRAIGNVPVFLPLVGIRHHSFTDSVHLDVGEFRALALKRFRNGGFPGARRAADDDKTHVRIVLPYGLPAAMPFLYFQAE